MEPVNPTLINSVGLMTLAQYNAFKDVKDPNDPDEKRPIIPPLGGDWWLQDYLTGTNSKTRYVYVVHNDQVQPATGLVNIGGIRIRPLLTMSRSILEPTPPHQILVGDTLRFANTDWVVLSGTLVLSKYSIGTGVFRNDWEDVSAQAYASSDIKMYLEEWLAFWK